ncbi:hypothetical protein HDU85_006323 [Gaertneriomyces sp. JEL0708]|nr:hypothetical protein HDU85_006323 [Gaertneriomyces sp. JEL0708]
MTTRQGPAARDFESQAPARAYGIPADIYDPHPKAMSHVNRDPELAALAEFGRGPSAAYIAKRRESNHESGKDHKLSGNSVNPNMSR